MRNGEHSTKPGTRELRLVRVCATKHERDMQEDLTAMIRQLSTFCQNPSSFTGRTQPNTSLKLR